VLEKTGSSEMVNFTVKLQVPQNDTAIRKEIITKQGSNLMSLKMLTVMVLLMIKP
jgi:hypothetical protein